MRRLTCKIFGEVNDGNRFEGALLNANAASDAQLLGDWRGGGGVVRGSTRTRKPATNSSLSNGNSLQATLLVASTVMHILPIDTTGQDRLHSWRHFFGLHLSSFIIAIRDFSSDSAIFLRTKVPDKNQNAFVR